MNQNLISFAYQDEVNLEGTSESESIDLLSSGVNKVILDNYPNLQRIRISKCDNLREVHLSNMPKLQVVDLLDNKYLKTVSFNNCPQLYTLEAGFCESLSTLTGIGSVRYLSIPSCYNLELESTPNIVYLDATYVEINPDQIISQCQNLECLICRSDSPLKLSDVTSNHSLQILELNETDIICDSIDDETNLKIIIFNIDSNGINDYAKGDLNLLEKFYVTTESQTNKDLNIFVMFNNFTPEYRSYQKMLYGPWGVPEVDKLPPIKVEQPIVTPPSQIDQAKAADSIIGAIFASAVFDMIGVGVEFMPDRIAKALLVGEPDITWSHPRCNDHNMRFVRGTPTDDTSQSILIMRALVYRNTTSSNSKSDFNVKGVKINPTDFGSDLVNWIYEGHKEHKHKGGLGCGSTTFKVINDQLFQTNPIQAAKNVWITSGKRIAPNGSVMRIASSGAFVFWDKEVVIRIAELYAKVTHADPRCVYSSIAAALIIAQYIQFNSGYTKEEPNIDQILEESKTYVEDIDDYMDDINYYNNCKNVDDLKLSQEGKIGYCLKAFGSGVWALRYCQSYNEAISKIMREGGDSDTNGAVVGALLGSKFGFKNIPDEYVRYMFVGQWIFREIDPYMKLMGIEMPPSPYM